MRRVHVNIDGTAYIKGSHIGGSTSMNFGGYFHRWADQPIEGGDGYQYVSCTMALIEDESGAMHLIHPSCIRFADVATKLGRLITFGTKILLKVPKEVISGPGLVNHECIKALTDHTDRPVNYVPGIVEFLNRTNLLDDRCYVIKAEEFEELITLDTGKYADKLRMVLSEPNIGVVIVISDSEDLGDSIRMKAIIARLLVIDSKELLGN